MSDYPKFLRVRQSFERPQVGDIRDEVHAELAGLSLAERVRRGQTVAITAGSRGVANIHLIAKSIVDYLKELGAEPLIVPAMGSHGGGTAEGQRRVIESYGITEAFCGCPIRSSMETVVVCRAAEGFPVHFDRHAYQADHVLVVNRVKPHTEFAGELQSGLMKMLLIGLGKHKGATIYHRAIQDYSFDRIVRSVAGEVLRRCRILAGLAIVENAYDETARIEAIESDRIPQREPDLLRLAAQWMAKLPFDTADILIVDEIGKNISGTGLDTNVVGRKTNDHQAAPDEYPKIKRIVVRGLTPESHGNAAGIGIAEFCTTRLVEQMDRRGTAINCLTANHLTAGMIPIHFDTDREILDAALLTLGLAPPQDARIMWIRNTLDLIELECSAAYLKEARSGENIEILGDLRPLAFDEKGNLIPSEDC